ncbi:MAG: spondin domain-containing protein [Gammaproteobacteria bacterium]|nr:spondin domain-containing protein [Gammaproteobacteria bacterium]
MKPRIIGLAAAISIFATTPVYADRIKVEITNITHGSWFTPLLVVAHRAGSDLFEVGQAASEPLEKVAEGGDIADLKTLAESLGGQTAVANDAPLGPGQTAVVNFRPRDTRLLSIVSMILPSNDAFVGLDSFRLRGLGRRTVLYLNSYDAGTEINDELLIPGAGFNIPGAPGDPGGNAGSGGTGITSIEPNTHIHTHAGIVGDSDPTGGPSDFDSAVHRWQDPVAKVVITRLR